MEQLELVSGTPEKPDLNWMFDHMSLDQSQSFFANVDLLAKRIIANRNIYSSVGQVVLIDWKIVGVIHAMEGNCDLVRSLRDGHFLTEYVFEVDAVNVLKDRSHPKNDDPRGLRYIEAHNGFGYRKPGIEIFSPYLWAGTQFYACGKFTTDGSFDKTAVSKQPGAAPILYRLEGILQSFEGDSNG